MNSIHKAADRGFAVAADAYARGRPDYPPVLADWLSDRLGLAEGRRVLDLGAGTGKFVPHLLASGADVVAVEPVEAMRDALSRGFPGIEVRAGTAESIPLADSSP
jgi:SAM-dependent methyltransferase